MFSLENQDVKIANVNFRAEKHGEDNVKACDLKIEATMHSSVLDCFDKSLRKSLYRKPAPGEQVAITFRASLHPDGRAAGKLFQLVQENVDVTLTPPSGEERQAA